MWDIPTAALLITGYAIGVAVAVPIYVFACERNERIFVVLREPLNAGIRRRGC